MAHTATRFFAALLLLVAMALPSRAGVALKLYYDPIPGLLVANLTTNYLHCFVEHALPIESVAAWLEQRRPVRMPIDRVGTVIV